MNCENCQKPAIKYGNIAYLCRECVEKLEWTRINRKMIKLRTYTEEQRDKVFLGFGFGFIAGRLYGQQESLELHKRLMERRNK